jgi:hypothetical protein
MLQTKPVQPAAPRSARAVPDMRRQAYAGLVIVVDDGHWILIIADEVATVGTCHQ